MSAVQGMLEDGDARSSNMRWLAVFTEGWVQVVGCNGRPALPVGSHLLSSELSCSGSTARAEHW